MPHLRNIASYSLLLMASVLLMGWLVHRYPIETAGAKPGVIVQDNGAEMPRQVHFVKHDTPRRQIQTASRTSEGKIYAPDGTPLSGVPPKDNKLSVGWKQWVLAHDHRDGSSGSSNSVTDDREALVLESLSKHKLKTPRIRRAVNETFSASTGTSITSTSDSAFPSSRSSETTVTSPSSSDSSSTVPSSTMDETLSRSGSEDSTTTTTSSSEISSVESSTGEETLSSASSAPSSVTNETPVSTSVWTSTLQGPGGTAVSTVTQTTVIYNIHSQTPSESVSSAVAAAPQLQTTADISEATRRSVGPSAAKAAVFLMGMFWLL
ncbi:hypothetical protein V1517DRAFT_316294 [Lipomyces orientalis]|uniref:Uncharacterized protein n=1 Tax=Lipomyces orientalis TaxID=1233043 RepID=A0ACC3TUX1_9ASCO